MGWSSNVSGNRSGYDQQLDHEEGLVDIILGGWEVKYYFMFALNNGFVLLACSRSKVLSYLVFRLAHNAYYSD
jgi:hypothetical protein